MKTIFRGARTVWIPAVHLTLNTGLFAQKPKSQKEVDGLMGIQNATSADARMKAVDDFLSKFADTEFKSKVLELAADAAERSNQYEKMTLYAERAIEADPKS